MRDIGARIRRYRLTRYASRHGSILSQLRWVWPFLLLWVAYMGLFSEHSLWRLWQLSREGSRMRAELATTRQELERIEAKMNDPKARREQGEHILRERNGWAKPGEIIYRIPVADSVPGSR